MAQELGEGLEESGTDQLRLQLAGGQSWDRVRVAAWPLGVSSRTCCRVSQGTPISRHLQQTHRVGRVGRGEGDFLSRFAPHAAHGQGTLNVSLTGSFCFMLWCKRKGGVKENHLL